MSVKVIKSFIVITSSNSGSSNNKKYNDPRITLHVTSDMCLASKIVITPSRCFRGRTDRVLQCESAYSLKIKNGVEWKSVGVPVHLIHCKF